MSRFLANSSGVLYKCCVEKAQLEKLKRWFGDYVAGFYGKDDYVNANLKLKEKHTRKTCIEMQWLAGELELDENNSLIAETIALLHDVGRFEQFINHRTYHDGRSTNHALLTLEVLERCGMLEGFQPEEKNIITEAIKYHGDRELPASLDGDLFLHARLIRDADKLDIYRVVIENYTAYLENPDVFLLEVELPDADQYSQEVVDSVINGEKINYSKLKTLNDMKLLQLGWVFDVNFHVTFKRIKQRRYLETLASFLPQTHDVERALRSAVDFVNAKIAEST